MVTTHRGIIKHKNTKVLTIIDMDHLLSIIGNTSKTFGGKLRSISHNNERPGGRNQAISLAKKRTRLITLFIPRGEWYQTSPKGEFDIISTEGNK